MSERSVLITGCSTGIGYCVAHGLAKRGYQVFATARKPEDVERLQAEGLETLQLDVTDTHSINSAVDTVLEQTKGTLYGLFNNAGFGQPGAIEDIPTEVLREQFETNFFGWHELTRRVIPVMRRQGEGRIIQNSSVLGFVALTFRGAYNASKYAVEGWSDTLRLELKGTNIHISLIEPGPVLSRFRENSYVAFTQNIDADSSIHRERYIAMVERLVADGAAVPFTLPPPACSVFSLFFS